MEPWRFERKSRSAFFMITYAGSLSYLCRLHGPMTLNQRGYHDMILHKLAREDKYQISQR